MGFGGFHPFPHRFGGGEPNLASLYGSLNQSLGPAYDTTDTSNVTAQTMAEARALDAVYSSNRRMVLQWDPTRMTDFLARWETIFDIHPAVIDSIPERRAVITAKFLALLGTATVEDIITPLLGSSFIGVEETTLIEALQRWPENGYPNDWISNTAHILIRVAYATNQSQAEFWKLMAKLGRVLDDFLPAWATWDWGTYNEGGTEGFFLDEPYLTALGPPPTNLNYETFSYEPVGRTSFRISTTAAASQHAVALVAFSSAGVARGTGKFAGTATVGLTTTGTATAV